MKEEKKKKKKKKVFSGTKEKECKLEACTFSTRKRGKLGEIREWKSGQKRKTRMLSKESIFAKLDTLVDTAVSIQTTSAWFLFHKRQIDFAVEVWKERVALPELSVTQRRLLLYLANDVMQSALKKGLQEVQRFCLGLFF